MAKQIVGWVLLLVGVTLIGWGVWDSYKIFTGQKSAPQALSYSFNVKDTPKLATSSVATNIQKPEQMQQQAQQQAQAMIQDQISKMLPSELLSKILNLFCWSLFMGILILAAGKIAMIGIGLLKKD